MGDTKEKMSNSQRWLRFKIKYTLIGTGKWGCSLSEESTWLLGKMDGPLEKQTGHQMDCEKVCLCGVPTSSLPSFDGSAFPG